MHGTQLLTSDRWLVCLLLPWEAAQCVGEVVFQGRRLATKHRPDGVTILALLLLVQGVLLVVLGIVVPALPAARMLPGVVARLLAAVSLGSLLPGVAQAGLGVAALITSIGIFQLRPWAWLMAMALQGVILVVLLIEYLLGGHSYLDMLLASVVALYLNWRPIRQAFDIAQHQAGMTPVVPMRRDLDPPALPRNAPATAVHDEED
jgi:hypothetical protein